MVVKENERVKVKLYVLSRDLIDAEGGATKQLALVIAYYENENEYEQEIVEVWNEKGFIKVTVKTHSTKPRRDWESAKGYEKQSLHDGFHELPSDRFAEEYAEEYTRSKNRFDLSNNNFQTFLDKFLKSALTAQVKQVAVKSAMTKSAQQLSYLGFKSYAMDKLGVYFPTPELKAAFEGIIKKLFSKCDPKMLESISSGLIGAFSPWQLLQIPVETLSYFISKLIKEDEEFANNIRRVCSVITSMSVGGVVAGSSVVAGSGAALVLRAAGMGATASAILWVIGEITSVIVRWVAAKAYEGLECLSRIVVQFLIKCISNGVQWVAVKSAMTKSAQQLSYLGFKSYAMDKLGVYFPTPELKAAFEGIIKKLFSKCGPKMLESISNGLIGAVSPWQLLQIPAETLSYLFTELISEDEEFARNIGKVCSVITSMSVGGVVAGTAVAAGSGAAVVLGAAGMGATASVLLWIIGEITPVIVRWVAAKAYEGYECLSRMVGQFLIKCISNRVEWICKMTEITEKQIKFVQKNLEAILSHPKQIHLD